MVRKFRFLLFLLLGVLSFSFITNGNAGVLERDGRVYIVDSYGEEWDVTEAREFGFNPNKFQYGIGRNAFVTLDDSLLTDSHDNIQPNERIIAIEDIEGGKAFSVDKLRRHEIANSWQNKDPVTVGY